MTALLTAIEYHLGERLETNADLAAEHPEWDMARLVAKLGVRQRCLAQPGETASDLAVRAAQKLFASGACTPDEIDFLLFCTQTPDHLIPTTACSLQTRLGIPTHAGALDFNLGCSGYIYGLSLAKGLVESGQARTVLLLTADTYSRLINPADRNVRLVFGDAAAATLIRAEAPGITGAKMTAFTFGTDGTGAENLIVRNGGLRTRGCPAPGGDFLEMNGGEIFNFTLRVVAPLVAEILRRAGTTLADVDGVVPHQANAYMLEHLREKLGVPPEKFAVTLADCGNTVSSSIPIALRQWRAEPQWFVEKRTLLLGFGVGYSWGGCLLG